MPHETPIRHPISKRRSARGALCLASVSWLALPLTAEALPIAPQTAVLAELAATPGIEAAAYGFDPCRHGSGVLGRLCCPPLPRDAARDPSLLRRCLPHRPHRVPESHVPRTHAENVRIPREHGGHDHLRPPQEPHRPGRPGPHPPGQPHPGKRAQDCRAQDCRAQDCRAQDSPSIIMTAMAARSAAAAWVAVVSAPAAPQVAARSVLAGR